MRKVLQIIGEKTSVKVFKDHPWNEYRVVPDGNTDTSYHTDDLKDACDTALCMAIPSLQRNKKIAAPN